MSQKIHPDSQTPSRSCNREVGQPPRIEGKRKDYLQTFFTHIDGTVGEGKTRTTVSDSVEGLVTKSSGLGGQIRWPRMEGGGCFVEKRWSKWRQRVNSYTFIPLPSDAMTIQRSTSEVAVGHPLVLESWVPIHVLLDNSTVGMYPALSPSTGGVQRGTV